MHGAQKPRYINRIIEVASTAQRSDSPAQAINQRFLGGKHEKSGIKGEKNMETRINGYFDILILIKLEALNLRKFAAAKPSLTVNDYFGMLSNFLHLVPKAKAAMAKFIHIKAEKDDYKIIDNMIRLLNDLGCNKFVANFHSVLDTYGQKGNWREAAAHAKQIKDEFNKFYLQIDSARISKKPDALSDTAISLKEFIKRLDEEEANRKPAILAVDDSIVMLQTISSVLSDEYKVLTLPKPLELEKVLRKFTPDLFLLDYNMPEINGFELIPIIRNMKEHQDTPIILLTSAGTIDNVTAALALGVCDFAIKPFNPDILRQKIAKHIVKKKSF